MFQLIVKIPFFVIRLTVTCVGTAGLRGKQYNDWLLLKRVNLMLDRRRTSDPYHHRARGLCLYTEGKLYVNAYLHIVLTYNLLFQLKFIIAYNMGRLVDNSLGED